MSCKQQYILRLPKILVIAIFILLTGKPIAAQIISVKQDGSGDFTQIQAAIDASQDGDTVLAWPGTYVENLIIQQKNITLASLHLTSNDPAHIDQTIIDGNHLNSCIIYDIVNFPSVLHGFTITNGQGNISTSTDPGGGIWIKSSLIEIHYCKIVHNKAGNGGGIYISTSEVTIKNSRISHNFVNQKGGGIYITGQGLSLSGTTISHNHSYMNGGGISYGGNIDFDSVNLCNIYSNYGCPGSDISRSSIGDTHYIPLDTFTVDQPDSYHLYSYLFPNEPFYPTDIVISMQHCKTPSVNADLYVSPQGSDTNSGMTPDKPLQHLAFAMAKMVSDSTHQNTIHLAEGSYALSMGEHFPMSLRNYIDVKGAGPELTVLDAEHSTTHFKVNRHYHSFSVTDLNILNSYGNYHGFYPYTCGISIIDGTNIAIKNTHFVENVSWITSGCSMQRTHSTSIDQCHFEDNHGNNAFQVNANYAYGDTILWKTDTVIISNTIFHHNLPSGNEPSLNGGAGAHIGGTDGYNDSLNVYFINCAFTENEHYSEYPQRGWTGMGVFSSGKATAVNCTFSGNHSENPNVRALGIVYDAEMSLYNCIIHNNPPGSMYIYSENMYAWDTCKLNVHYSLFEGGHEEILQVGNKIVINYAASNIDTDPMFYGQGEYPYYLQAGSPCIDAGTLDLPPEIELPETDLAGNPRVYNGYIDMGAYEHGPWVGIQNPESSIQNSELLQIWPNPFRYQTNISYIISEKGRAVIRVYDLNGRCVKTILDVDGQPGEGHMQWRGTDDKGNTLQAGTYIISISINGKERDAVKVVKN